MTLTLDISDDLKPEEASELVDMAREQNRPVGMLILEAARKLALQRRKARGGNNNTNSKKGGIES